MQKNIRGWRRPVIAVLTSTLVLAACGGGGSSAGAGEEARRSVEQDDPIAPRPLEEETRLIVTLPIKLEGFAQVLLADHFGEFAAENLDVELVTMPGNEATTLLSTGKADVQLGGPSAAMFNAIEQGADLTWAASNYLPAPESKSGLWLDDELLDTDGEPDPDKVRGSTIAFGSLGKDGTVFTYVIEDWLEEMGLTLADVEEKKLTGADLLVALETGSIDGGFMLDPFWQELEKSSGFTFIVGQDDSHGGYILGSSRHDKAEAIEAFFRAILRTNTLYLDGDYHSDQVVLDALSEIIEVPAEDIERTPSLTFVQDLEIDPEVAQRIQRLWMDLDVLQYDELKPLDAFVDQSLLRAARDEA